jgi:uncharacterized protein
MMGKPAESRRAVEQAGERIKNWLRETVMLMVDHADEVKVIEGSVRDNDTQLKIVVHTDDAGKVIGKGGRNVRSLRIALLAISGAIGHNYTLDVVDANESKRSEQVSRYRAVMDHLNDGN